MADTVDSISIELTASTESAESSIDRLIGKLNQLKGAVAGASNFSRVAKGIASIAAVASGIEGDAGKKLHHLAAGLTSLSKVGNLSNLKDAGKNLSSVVKAVGGMGQGGKGLSGLADGIRQTNDALGGIKDSDVSKLGAVRDALAGEVSGPLHTSERVNESAALGGIGAPEPSFGNMAAYGAMTVFKYTADSIREATAAYREFQAALGGGMPPVFTDFSDSAAQAGESVRMLTGTVGGGQEGVWEADEIRDAARAYDDLGGSALRAADVIETEFSDTEKASNGLVGLREALGSIGNYMANDIITVFTNIGNAIKNFASSVLRIARYRLIRSMIRTITEGFTEGKKNLYEWSQAMDGHFAASMDRLATSTQYLKNSLGTLVGPLMEALEPALNWIIDALVTAINYFNMFVAAISGKSTYTAAVRAATTWGSAVGKAASNAANAAGNASNAVSNAVEDMKRTIMGFDEINKLNDVTDSGSGSGGSGGGGGGGVGGSVGEMFEERELSGGFQQFSNALELALQDSLSKITLIVGAAELAVGAILALSGANVPLGLALIATGAVTMGSAIFANWEGISDEIKVVVGAIEAALGGGLAVGAILAFSGGHIGLGIGLMVAALSLEFSAVTVVWTTLKDKIGGEIRAIEVLVGGALIGIGAVLAFAGQPAIGLSMLLAGLTIEAVAIDWGALTGKVGEKINELKGLIVGAEIVLGVIFLLTGNIPLGLALLISGGIGAGLELVNNWGNITEWFTERWAEFKKAAEDTWDSLKEIGAGIWGKIKEGVTGAVAGVGGWIKEHIFQPFIDAWHWLLGLFGGGNESNVTANASVNIVSNAGSVADDIADGATDKESIQKLKEIGATMGDAIKTGLNDRLKNISGEIWDTIVTGWVSDTRELPVNVTFGTNGSIDVPENIEIPVKLKKDGWTSISNYIGTHTASVGIVISTKASDLWSEFKSAWEAAKTSLYASCKLDNTGAVLWNSFKNEWDETGSKTLYLSPKLDNSAAVLYNAFRAEWDAQGSKALYFSPKLDNTAQTLYDAFKKAWDAAGSTTLYLSPKLDNTGAVLWNGFKSEWDAAKSTLYGSPKLDNTGAVLWNGFKSEWDAAKSTLYASPKLDNTGAVLWNGFKSEWDAAKSTLYGSPKLDNTGTVLWNTLKSEWDKAKVALYASPKLDNTAAVLWAGFKAAWDSAAETLKVEVELDYSGTDGFGGATGGGGSTSGGGVGRTTTVKIPVEPETTVEGKSFWDRLKDALSATGNAIDKGLDVVVRPALNAAGDRITSLSQWLFGTGTNNTSDSSSLTVPVSMEKTWKVTPLEWLGLSSLSATVSMSMSKSWKNTALEWLGLNKLSAAVSMSMSKSWKNTALEWLGLSSLSATVSMSMSKSWKNTALEWLGLNKLSATVSMSMSKSWKNTALEWLGLNKLSATVSMSMSKSWSGSAKKWLGVDNLSDTVKMSMSKSWSGSAKKWLGLEDLSTKVKVSLQKGSPNKITVSKSGDTQWQLQVKKRGGIFANGIWRNIAQYASGTTNATHGSMFIAGEAGPELVGHVGGRTEVLNQSQLAATMFSAVRSAMSGVKIAATMYEGGGDSGEADYEAMYRAMYDAFTDAMAGSDERDREKVALMRQIAAKEFTAEVTAASMNRAQTRMNRRAGTTIVPVGT